MTLIGVGGVGKTRLALQVAAEELDAFPDGVWLVELASSGEPSRVVLALAAALGVEPTPGKTIQQAIVDKVKTSAVLVVTTASTCWMRPDVSWGDQRYQSLAAQGATLPLEAFVDEMIANLDQFLAEAETKSSARSEEASA